MVQVCIADITKGRVAVLGHAWDCHAGGRDMDEALMTHFAREFRGRTGLNAMDDPKAHAKLLVKAVKCRELLTACSTAHVRIDSLMGGRDLRFASRLHSTPTAQHTRSTPTAHPQHTHICRRGRCCPAIVMRAAHAPSFTHMAQACAAAPHMYDTHHWLAACELLSTVQLEAGLC